MKACTKCGEMKALAAFGPRGGGLHSWCRPCLNAASQASRARLSTPKRMQRNRAHRLWTHYRLTIEVWDRLLAAQGGGCAICGAANPGGRWAAFHVDHDHTCCPGDRSCGECVRGLLCQKCNIGLGHFDDSMERLSQAMTYLTQSTEDDNLALGLTR